MENVTNIRRKFANALEKKEFVEDKSGVKTLELIGQTFFANDNTIFGEVNEDYIKREIEWYNSMSRSVYDFPGGAPTIWQEVADRYGKINSNYGWALYSEENHNQYYNVIEALQKNPNTRQAVAIYTRPSMHYDATVDGMSDFMCTNTVQYFIREEYDIPCLTVIVNMRSNDVIFGYRNDYAWQRHVAKNLIKDLQLPEHSPTIIWQVGSLHIYERHFWMVNAYNLFNQPKMTKQEYNEKLYLGN